MLRTVITAATTAAVQVVRTAIRQAAHQVPVSLDGDSSGVNNGVRAAGRWAEALLASASEYEIRAGHGE